MLFFKTVQSTKVYLRLNIKVIIYYKVMMFLNRCEHYNETISQQNLCQSFELKLNSLFILSLNVVDYQHTFHLLKL